MEAIKKKAFIISKNFKLAKDGLKSRLQLISNRKWAFEFDGTCLIFHKFYLNLLLTITVCSFDLKLHNWNENLIILIFRNIKS
jgi:hypothetical protein